VVHGRSLHTLHPTGIGRWGGDMRSAGGQSNEVKSCTILAYSGGFLMILVPSHHSPF